MIYTETIRYIPTQVLYKLQRVSLAHLLRHGSQMSVFVVLRLEERIAQCHRLDPLHSDIIRKFRVNVEKDRHVHGLARIQPLLLEAKALDLGEIRRHLARCHAVGSHPNDILFRRIGGCVEGQRRLSRQDSHFALLGDKLPGKDVRGGAVECYAYARVVLDGAEAFGGVAGVVAVGSGFDGLPAPAGGLADLKWFRKCNVLNPTSNIPSYTLALSHRKALLCRELC